MPQNHNRNISTNTAYTQDEHFSSDSGSDADNPTIKEYNASEAHDEAQQNQADGTANQRVGARGPTAAAAADPNRNPCKHRAVDHDHCAWDVSKPEWKTLADNGEDIERHRLCWTRFEAAALAGPPRYVQRLYAEALLDLRTDPADPKSANLVEVAPESPASRDVLLAIFGGTEGRGLGIVQRLIERRVRFPLAHMRVAKVAADANRGARDGRRKPFARTVGGSFVTLSSFLPVEEKRALSEKVPGETGKE